jgi:hypothetical protein
MAPGELAQAIHAELCRQVDALDRIAGRGAGLELAAEFAAIRRRYDVASTKLGGACWPASKTPQRLAHESRCPWDAMD